jgi:hypothetical protein
VSSICLEMPSQYSRKSSALLHGTFIVNTQLKASCLLPRCQCSRVYMCFQSSYHLSPCSAEIKNMWSCTSTPHSFIECCLIKNSDNFTFETMQVTQNVVTFSVQGFVLNSHVILSVAFSFLVLAIHHRICDLLLSVPRCCSG